MNIIDCVKWMYGFNTREAREYIKTATPETLKAISDCCDNQCKLALYND